MDPRAAAQQAGSTAEPVPEPRREPPPATSRVAVPRELLHQLGNVLTPMLLAVQTLQRRGGHDELAASLLATIEECTTQAAELVEQARQGPSGERQ